jgi:hypothetical protein
VLSALDADKVSTLGLLLVVGLVVIGLVVAVLARAVALKVLGIVLLVGLSLLVWTKRSDLHDCMDQARGAATSDAPGQCRFLGLKVDVNAP